MRSTPLTGAIAIALWHLSGLARRRERTEQLEKELGYCPFMRSHQRTVRGSTQPSAAHEQLPLAPLQAAFRTQTRLLLTFRAQPSYYYLKKSS